jgi:predicted PurR-regulated permease PerM
MSIFDQRTARVLATICAFVAIGAFLYAVRHTLVAILFAVLFAYLLEPVVCRIEGSKLARGSR